MDVIDLYELCNTGFSKSCMLDFALVTCSAIHLIVLSDNEPPLAASLSLTVAILLSIFLFAQQFLDYLLYNSVAG